MLSNTKDARHHEKSYRHLAALIKIGKKKVDLLLPVPFCSASQNLTFTPS